MKLLLDMDGVVANLVKGIAEKFDVENTYIYGNKCEYDLEKEFGVPHSKIWVNLDKEFWMNLEPYDWAHDLTAYLIDLFGVDNVAILTKPCGTDGCYDGKMAWLKKHLPEIKNVLVGNSKHFCADSHSILIDDHEGNVEKFRAHGGKAFLFAGPWNSKYTVLDPLEDLKLNFTKCILNG